MARKALDNAAELDLDVENGALVLERTDTSGKVDRLRLTLDDLVYLSQYIPQYLQGLIAARRQELALDPDRDMDFFVPVADVETKSNEANARLLLTLEDERGHKAQFSLSPALARKLADAIERHAGKRQ